MSAGGHPSAEPGRSPAPPARTRVSIDLVTVVFAAELPLLALQARSIARHVDPRSLGRIVVIVNDRDERACAAAVERLRGEYGALGERLRVLLPAALIETPRGVPARLRHAFVSRWRGRLKALLRRRRRNPAGWAGNNGWSMQQAFKLLSVHACRGTHVVFLDAKNHFLAPLDASAFVAADGRARTRALEPDAKQRGWIDASFARLVLTPPAGAAPPTVTPFAIERAVLHDAVERLARRLGPLECFFALRRGRATEFMLLYAVIDRGEGRWWKVFADGLPVSLTVFRTLGHAHDDREALLGAVRRARRDEAPLMGVHRTQLERLDAEVRRELVALWRERGLVRDADDAARLLASAAA